MIGVGAVVRTKGLGLATVEAVNGQVATVALHTFKVRATQLLTELELVTPGSNGTGSDREPHGTRDERPAREPARPNPARQSIEALRFGLVPHQHLDELTIGLDSLSRWVASRLPDANRGAPQAAEVCGAFGAGKSHMMALVRHIARGHNYLTARVEVDGYGVSLANPERLLYALWSTLQGRDLESDTPLLDLYTAALQRSRIAPRVAADGIDRIQDNFGVVKQAVQQQKLDLVTHVIDAMVSSSDEYTAADASRILREHMVIDPSVGQLRRMIGRSIEDRPYHFVESIAGHALLAKQAGYAGLVITVDEFEVESAMLTTENRRRVADLISVLDDYLSGHSGHRVSPVALFFASVGDADHEGDQIIERLIRGHPDRRFVLRPLSRSDHMQLARRIHSLYASAYDVNDSFDEALAGQVDARLDVEHGSASGRTRAFIKSYVATLDTIYGPPQKTA